MVAHIGDDGDEISFNVKNNRGGRISLLLEHSSRRAVVEGLKAIET